MLKSYTAGVRGSGVRDWREVIVEASEAFSLFPSP